MAENEKRKTKVAEKAMKMLFFSEASPPATLALWVTVIYRYFKERCKIRHSSCISQRFK